MVCLALHLENYFLEERAQEFFAIAIRGCGRTPHEPQVGAESINSLTFFLGQSTRALLFPTTQFRFRRRKFLQPCFPFLF